MATADSSFSRIGLLCTIVALAGCGDGQDTVNETAIVEMPSFDEDPLMQGRSVWMQTCRACHLMGVGGAPAVTDFAQWDVRLPKGSDALAHNVINGITDEAGAYRMPPRGGNSRLTDQQIRLAVGYKIAAIEALRGK